jgi:hypothetical protein
LIDNRKERRVFALMARGHYRTPLKKVKLQFISKPEPLLARVCLRLRGFQWNRLLEALSADTIPRRESIALEPGQALADVLELRAGPENGCKCN